MSGYRDCACRDCFEIFIGDGPTLCDDCKRAGCDVCDCVDADLCARGRVHHECQVEWFNSEAVATSETIHELEHEDGECHEAERGGECDGD